MNKKIVETILVCDEILNEFNELDFYLTDGPEGVTTTSADGTETKTITNFDYEWLKNDLVKCIKLDELRDEPKNLNLWINFTLDLMENKYNMTVVKKSS